MGYFIGHITLNSYNFRNPQDAQDQENPMAKRCMSDKHNYMR